jgi:hypothetical protein
MYPDVVDNRNFVKDNKKNNTNTGWGKRRGNKRARVTRGSRNPKHGKRRHYIVHKPSTLK